MATNGPQVRNGVLTVRDDGCDIAVPVGGADWYRWLDDPDTRLFAFADGARRFTARRERRGTRGYWYAYRRQNGRLCKRYLGRASDLTQKRLEEVAARFTESHGSEECSPLRGGPSVMPRHNLPSPVSSFLGRADAIDAVTSLIRASRLVTLAGPGGIGKTRLAHRVAGDLAGKAYDVVWLVELAVLRDPDLVPHAVMQAIGILEEPGQPLVATLAAALHEHHVLLLLDNCEHLLAPCADLADRLLRACPDLRILTTSREPLGLPGESVWRVPGLGFDAIDAESLSTTPCQSEAMELFVERARSARPGFVFGPTDAAAIATICRRLDGLPLAIELAAAQMAIWSPGEIAPRFQADARLPGTGRRGTARHRTLDSTIDWSHDLLSPREQRCFAHLAVFAGEFSLDAASAVCVEPEVPADQVWEVLARLVQRSLVQAEPDSGGASRFRLLETLRVYAYDRLTERGELAQAHDRHVAWLLVRAEEAAAAYHGPNQGVWLAWARREFENVRAALAWTLQKRDANASVRLAAAFAWPWLVHGHWSEGLEWSQRALALPYQHPIRERGLLLIGAFQHAAFRGDLSSNRPSGDLDALGGWVSECFLLGESLADDDLRLAGTGTAELLREFGVPVPGVPKMSREQALVEARRIGHAWGERRALEALARDGLDRQDFTAAREWFAQAVASARRDGDTWSLALALNELGDVERAIGAHARAIPLYEESAALFARLGLGRQSNLLHNLGYTALAMGELGQAASYLQESLAQCQRTGERRGMAECLIGLGALATAERRPLDAARLFGAGEAALAALGQPMWPANRADYERWLARAKMTRSVAAFERGLAAGKAIPLSIAVTWALGGELPAELAEPAPQSRTPLTRREDAVARLAAQGLTNRQIGDALTITEKTAANHLLRALEKLDVRTRSQLAAQARDLGLASS